MPRFSVIIPCYNCSKTLPKTLISCINQEFNDFEVILIDDCGKEKIDGIYHRFLTMFEKKNIRIKYFRNSLNSGVSFSRNVGWNNAMGEFICFLDSDDIWHESKLKIVNFFLNKNECDILCHSYTDQRNDFLFKKNRFDYSIKKIGLISMLIHNPSQTSCFVLKKSICDQFDVTMRYSEDYELWLRISKNYPIYCLHGSPLTLLLRPEQTPGGLSGDRIKMRQGEMIAYLKFTKSNYKLIFLFPLLFIYSILKHIRSEIYYACQSRKRN